MNGEELRARSERVDQLLGELERSAGPVLWPRVEELVSALLEIHGAGLSRMLDLARAAAADGAALDDLLSRDDLLFALMILHRLRPEPEVGLIPADRLVRGAAG